MQRLKLKIQRLKLKMQKLKLKMQRLKLKKQFNANWREKAKANSKKW